MVKTTAALSITLVLCVFYTVQCQLPMSRTEKELRKNITEIIQYIVHPNATISEDIVNFALATGREPQTQQERLTYLDLIKTIARSTPEFMKDYTNTIVLADGTKFESIDEMRLDKTVTDRAIHYLNHGLPNSNAVPGSNVAPNTGTGSAGAVNPLVGNANNVQNGLTGQMPTTVGPMLSMLDVFQMMGGANPMMGGANPMMGQGGVNPMMGGANQWMAANQWGGGWMG